MEESTKKELEELKKVVGEALSKIDKLESQETIHQTGEVTNQDVEDGLDIYLMDGINYEKVYFDKLDLEDDTVFEDVTLDKEDLVAEKLSAEALLNSLGLTLDDSEEVRFRSLPEEYYLTEDNGGINYTHFNNKTKHTLPTQQENRGTHLHQEHIQIEQVYDNIDSLKSDIYKETGIDCTILDEIAILLEGLRETQNPLLLNELNKDGIERIIKRGVGGHATVLGYFLTEKEEDRVNVATVSFIVDRKDTQGLWLLSYDGVYPLDGYAEEFIIMETEYPDLSEFILSGVQNIPEDMLQELLSGEKQVN